MSAHDLLRRAAFRVYGVSGVNTADAIAREAEGAELIRRADAEPRLRGALEALIEHHRDGTQCDTRERWWPESCEVADRAARAALTTPDTTGEGR